MELYYFHVIHDGSREEDSQGVMLRDRKHAWDEATKACGEMIREIDGNLAMGSDWKMEVWDSQGPVFVIHFGAHHTR